MEPSKIEESIDFRPASELLWQQLRSLIAEHIGYFHSFTRLASLWLCLLLLLATASALSLLVTLLIYSSPFWSAVTLATSISSSCALFVVQRYLTIYKNEREAQLVDKFTHGCCQAIGFRNEVADHHLALASGYCFFAETLQSPTSPSNYHNTSLLTSFRLLLERTIDRCCLRDREQLQEKLLKCSLTEYLWLIRRDPLNLSYHSQLANSYLLLANQYQLSAQRRHRSQPLEQARRQAIEWAVKEFAIIAEYAQDDPWVYSQLADSYKQLGMSEREIDACSLLLKLCPNDSELLIRLGRLYFSSGQQGKGLELYRQLLSIDPESASRLIEAYGQSASVNHSLDRAF